jgi:hypothetical protein
VDRDRDPELRHTVLSLVALRDLEQTIAACGDDRDRGIEAFCAQNDGDGWMLPDKLRLADLGLGHDERARHPLPVRERMGERFLPWQLEQSVEESWAECRWHASNILGTEAYEHLQLQLRGGAHEEATDQAAGSLLNHPREQDRVVPSAQPDLFGEAREDARGKRGTTT